MTERACGGREREEGGMALSEKVRDTEIETGRTWHRA